MPSSKTQPTITDPFQGPYQMKDTLNVQARQQAAVAAFGQKALAGVEPWELLEIAASSVTQTMELEFSAIFEFLPEEQGLYLRAGEGWQEGAVGRDTIKITAKSPAGLTLQTQEVVIVEDLAAETRFEPSLLLLNHGIASGIHVIIPGEKQPFGVLAAYTTQKRGFTQDDLNFLHGIAYTLALALQRNRSEEALRTSNTLLQTILEGTPDPIFVKDQQGKIIIINSAGAQIIGKSVEEVVGRLDTELWPADRIQAIRQGDQWVMATGQAQTFENPTDTPEGVQVFHTIKSPYRDAQGQIIGVIGIARDITDLKQAELSQRMLAEAGQLLASPLDYKTRLASVARLAVPRMADWCAVDILDEDGQVQRLAVAHVDPAKVELAHELQRRYPPDPQAQSGVYHILKTGQSELYPKITDELLVAGAQDEEHLRIARELQMKSAMAVPLVARGRTLGVITFVWAESNRYYDIVDLSLAEELARRAALALDNARLFNAEQEARQAAEWSAKRITSLQAITAALARALTPAEVAEAITAQGLSSLKADSGVVALLTPDKEELEIVHVFDYTNKVTESGRRFPLSAQVPLAETVRTGRALYISSPEDMARRFPDFTPSRATSAQAWVTLPLTFEGRTLGGIGLSFSQPQSFSRKERAFMTVIARQCAQAMERAHLFEAERAARAEAETAQKHLALLAETRERNRLAQELHDTVAQALGYLNLKITVTNELLAKGQVEEATAHLGELKQVVSETYTDVREEIFNLRAKVFSGISFLEMVDRYIDKYQRFYHLDIQLIQEADPALFKFPQEVGPQIMRILQEALINVRKHAGVNQATLRLSEEGEKIVIIVEDEGQGFDPARIAGAGTTSFGLQIMQERVKSVGGTLEFDTVPGRGTRVILRYPKR